MTDLQSIYKKALTFDKGGDWVGAHDLIQDLSTAEASWIHAYLHRKEGDDWNANYWYQKAGRKFFSGSLDEEWEIIWEQVAN